jgi:hypothetical protein
VRAPSRCDVVGVAGCILATAWWVRIGKVNALSQSCGRTRTVACTGRTHMHAREHTHTMPARAVQNKGEQRVA